MNTTSQTESLYMPLRLKKGELFSLHRENFESEQPTVYNRHHHVELILVEKGTLGCFIDGGFFTAISGDIVAINPMKSHRLARISNEPLDIWVLGFDEKVLLSDGLETGGRSFDELIRDPQISGLFRLIVQEKKQLAAWHNIYIQNLIRLIVLRILRDHASATPEENKFPPLLQSVISYIHENFSQQLTLEIIGNAVGISRWYLSKFFKKETGMSIVDYINQYRCSHALVLLLKSDYAISKISEICGFASLEYFSRVYIKQYGHPPSHERKLEDKKDLSSGLFASSLSASSDIIAIKSKTKK